MTNYTKKSILKLKPSSTLVINEKSKKLISKGKKQGFLNYSEVEEALINEQSEEKEEFYSKVDNLNIQIFNNHLQNLNTNFLEFKSMTYDHYKLSRTSVYNTLFNNNIVNNSKKTLGI